jgi:hypothetical protein
MDIDLFLCRVIRPQSRENYQVVLKDNGHERSALSAFSLRAGTLGGIDTMIPIKGFEAEGSGKDR